MSLDEFDNAYNPNDTGRTATLESLSDGDYQLMVQSAELTTTERTGEQILRWVYVVMSGPSGVGTVVESVNFFRSQVAVNLLGADLALLGLPTHEWTVANGKPFSRMLKQALPQLDNVTFSASKVTVERNGKTYHNLRIRGRSTAPASMPTLEKARLPF